VPPLQFECGSLPRDMEFYGERQQAASQQVEYDGIEMSNTGPMWNMIEEMKNLEYHPVS